MEDDVDLFLMIGDSIVRWDLFLLAFVILLAICI